MRYIYIIIFTIFYMACSGTSSGKGFTDSFGEAITFNNTTSLSDILAHKEDSLGKEFKIEGTVTEVCQKKGCWMDIKDGDDVVTVRFKDYAFFVPKDGAGRKAIIQAIFTKETYEDTDEHGNMVNKDYYQFIASGVELQKPVRD